MIGGDHRLEVGDDDLGIFLGEIGADHDAVEGRQISLDAVKDLSRETAERQQLGERNEVGMRVDLLLLEIGRADLRALADQLEEIRRVAAVLHRLQHHAVRGGAERYADELAFEIGEFVVGRILVDDDAVAGAGQAVGGDADQAALAFGIALEGEAVHDQRIVAHHADLELVRHHRIGDGRTGREILPLQLELDVGVFAVLREVFFKEMQLADDDAGGHRVGRGVLRSDAERHGFRRGRQREQQRQRRHRHRDRERGKMADHSHPHSVGCAVVAMIG